MFEKTKHVHMIGIGGIGMSALAKWLHAEGVTVTGSDVHRSDITHDLERRGITVVSGHAADQVPETCDLVICTPAILETNSERVAAVQRGIRILTNFEFLGEISKSFSTIVVTGTNGKSTTTAMLGRILVEAGYDPTVLVGSMVPGFPDGNIRIGKGRFFVVEGCEYRANMMHFDPEMIVLTNIEEDHLDYYRNLEHIQETFQQFVNKLQGKGLAVYNANDAGTRPIKFARAVAYGMDVRTDYEVRDRETSQGAQKVDVYREEDGDVRLGPLELQVPGAFNVMNALAAIAAAMELGVPFETCRRTLKEFTGIWRRFERLGVWQGADLISDYGHHPSGIKGTLEAAREFFPGRRIVLCYEPHQHDRTKKLFNDLVETLRLADHLVISEIYDVAGRNEEHDISSRDLVQEIKKRDPAKDVQFAEDHDAAEALLRDLIKAQDVLIIMGAGDIDVLARKLQV
ncbi:UDP-N-acetylmuramate--L-alanine ligase [Candidatus Uhrbacteria bacterium CG_4_9_14_3_um_filter_50_9]|uniref:UDP-N-acetylmuramate--L-alanine ligase n=1 Tax=Candidatus Uhrbacteria bacterium CG_4_9_14_3_um_filter_50_9 TaxID=1975035 RepID=A0A2M7XEX5_9BACT|nr:MAG: UDP-N-acetylmuramate--L-alanine ligase [Candidatus Uhrbacteria bacterium CG_4_9_14_3_um_filter_50_9]